MPVPPAAAAVFAPLADAERAPDEAASGSSPAPPCEHEHPALDAEFETCC